MVKLFELNPSTRMVDLDKEWISTIKEFRTILKRDKGSPGDVQGRNKQQAMREFTFIYHYCDYRSQFINYSHKDRLKKALKNAELDENLDIKKDEELMQAIEVYKALQETPALKILTELLEGIHVGYKVVNKIRTDLEEKLDSLDVETMVEEKVGGKTIYVDPLVRIKNRLDSIIDVANQLPKTLKTIEDLSDKIKKELSDAPNLRGAAQKGVREDSGSNFSGLPKITQ